MYLRKGESHANTSQSFYEGWQCIGRASSLSGPAQRCLSVGETVYGAVKTFSDIRIRCIGTVQPMLASDLIKGVAFTGKVDEGLTKGTSL